MAGSGVDIAQAYVHLIPSMEGAQGTIADVLTPGANKAGEQAGKSAGGKFSGSFKKGLVALGAVAAVTGAFAGMWKIGDTFDQMANSIRVGTGATGDDLEGLVQVAKNVGKTVPNEFGDIGTAVADINTRMGLSGETMETVAAQYLQAGNILGEAVDVGKTSAAFSAFKIEGDDVSKSMDHLFQVSQATGVGMNDLASQVSENAPAVQALGFSFEETAVLIGSLDKAGLNSTQVMSSMSRGLVNLAKDGEEPAEAFQRVQSEIGGFIESGDKAAALDLASEVFGTRGASQFIGALESGAINMDDLGKAAGQTADTILGTAEETMSFGQQWDVVKNNATLALEPLASGIFSTISTALTDMMPSIQAFGAWLGENQWVLGIVAGIIGVTLVAAVVAWTTSIWAANAALLASPITWIVLGLVALVAGIVYLATQTEFFQTIWDAVWGFIQTSIQVAGDFIGSTLTWISDTWSAVWSAVSSFAQSVWDAITGFISSAITGVQTVISNVVSAISATWSSVWNTIKTVASAVWAGIVAFVTGYINAVKLVISTVINAIKSIWSSVWNGIKSVAKSVWEGIVGFVKTYINNVKTNISNILNTIKSIWSSGWNFVKTTVSNIWDGIMGFFSGAVSTVSGIFGRIGDAIMTPFRNAFNSIAGFWNNTVGKISFTIPDWVPGVGGSGWSVPNIPMLAKGGVVTKPTLAVVGEAGPEAVIPLSKLSQHVPEGGGGGMASGDVDRIIYALQKLAERPVEVQADIGVSDISQGLYARGSNSNRSNGKVSLGGPVS